MLFKEGDFVFEHFANKLDKHYLALENEGYDLCALEGIHIQHISQSDSVMTLMFEDYSCSNVVVDYKREGNWVDNAVEAVLVHLNIK